MGPQTNHYQGALGGPAATFAAWSVWMNAPRWVRAGLVHHEALIDHQEEYLAWVSRETPGPR
jgi:hypothetical protein